jgi:hypothetical protein
VVSPSGFPAYFCGFPAYFCEASHAVYCFDVLLVVLFVPKHREVCLYVPNYSVYLALYCSHNVQGFTFPCVFVGVGPAHLLALRPWGTS